MLKNAHARRTLALFTQGRALHRDPSRKTGLAPRVIAEEAGVSAQEAVRCRDNLPVSFEVAEKMAAWNGLDLTRVLGSDPGRGRR